MKIKPVIIGISGTELTEGEKELFRAHHPLGVILFRRNIKFKHGESGEIIQDKQQLITLVQSIKQELGEKCIIAVDQEGGRVKKLIAPTFKDAPNAKTFGDMVAQEGIDTAYKKCKQNYKEIALELKEVGINLNFAPVADLLHQGAHSIVGDRSFGGDKDTVVALCKAAIEGMAEAKIMSCIKHIPGHGRATKDSHHDLPIVKTSLTELEKTDFVVFKELSNFPAAKLAMTAHIVYSALDAGNPVTISKVAIDYIRDKIGFKGFLITDAIEMKALSKTMSMKEITQKAFDVGVDIILECSGNIDNITQVLDATPERLSDDFSSLIL